MNDKVATNAFIREDASDRDWIHQISVGTVEINVGGAEMLFAMKLLASRPWRDFPDLDVLADAIGVTSRDEAIEIFERRYPEHPLPKRSAAWFEHRFGA